MTDVRLFVLPAVLLAGVIGYVALNPTGAAVEPIAKETPLPAAKATNTPRPPTPTATPFPGEFQLEGLSGTLTYQSTGLVSVEFPSGKVVESRELPSSLRTSSDGAWRENLVCREHGGCSVSFTPVQGGRGTELAGEYNTTAGTRWHPLSRAYAISDGDANDGPAKRIFVIQDVADPVARLAYEAGDANINSFEWFGDALLVSESAGVSTDIRVIGMSGAASTVASFDTVVPYFHPSTDGQTFAFAASDPDGWRLLTIDAAGGEVVDRGAMGSDGPGGVPVPDPPDGGKGPMYIAWSPEGSRLAFGGGFEPPYTMTVVDLSSGGVARTEFASGYPGEMRWSPDGTQLAVSTYDVERTHHETWVVDPAVGAGVHLMNGCIIVWSPDSRFLAVHGEDVPGIAIVETATGARMQLTANSTDTPLLWTE
jgi:Tol biopolymer transport system component